MKTRKTVRCPECSRKVAVDDSDKMERHCRGSWSFNDCYGSHKTRGDILLEREQRALDVVRSRERILQRRIDDAKADIARAESELAALPAAIKKAEKKLAALRKKLAAKGGAQ